MNSPNPQSANTKAVAYASLRAAVKAQDWDTVLDLVDNHGIEVDTRIGSNRRTLAQHAAYKGSLDALKSLHARGASLEGIRDQSGQDVIHSAVKGVRYDVVEWLAGQGVNLDICAEAKKPQRHNPYGPRQTLGQYATPEKTPLQMALKANCQPMARLLLDCGASPDAPDLNGNTPLMEVVQSTLTRASRVSMNLLLAYGADVDAVNKQDVNTLQMAFRSLAYRGHAELLLDAGASAYNPAAAKTLPEYVESHSYTIRDKMLEFLEQRMTLPVLDTSKPFTKADLFAPNAAGYAPLDNRRVWAEIDTIADTLAAQGEPLTKADMMQPNALGKPWLHRAIDCRAYTPLAKALAKHDTPITGRDFADTSNSRSQLSDLGLYAEDAYLGRTDLGKKDYWQDKGVEAFSAFCRELPPVLRDQITNRYRLVQSLRETNTPPQRGR